MVGDRDGNDRAATTAVRIRYSPTILSNDTCKRREYGVYINRIVCIIKGDEGEEVEYRSHSRATTVHASGAGLERLSDRTNSRQRKKIARGGWGEGNEGGVCGIETRSSAVRVAKLGKIRPR